MGQSSSKSQRGSSAAPESVRVSSPPPQQPVAHLAPEDSEHASTSADPATRTSRRSSIRKSVMNLMRPSAAREKSDSPAENRRSWRNSRRWSKSPMEFAPSQPTVPEANEQPQLTELERSPSSRPATPPAPLSDKGKEPERYTDDVPQDVDFELHDPVDERQSDRPSTPYPSSALDEHQTQQNFAAWLSERPEAESSSSSSGNQPPDDIGTIEEPPPIIHEPETTQEDEIVEPDLAPSPQPPAMPNPQSSSSTSPRQFPPPGTLVVVQGIVHTTDVSRPNSSSHSTPSPAPELPTSQSDGSSRSLSSLGLEGNASRARNRLSALLRPRPSSRASSSRPSSTLFPDTPTHSSLPSPLERSSSRFEDSTPDTGLTTPSFNEAAISGAADGPSPLDAEPTSNSASNENSNGTSSHARAPVISPGSIDVLGTLLSVAAAATAASLLTGSSEPILASGLAPAGASSRVPGNGNPNPLAGGTGYPSHGVQPSLSSSSAPPENYAATRAERMRQAWGTIRERLGLRPNPPSSQPSLGTNGHIGGDGGSTDQITDTRELMLAEMARAFNIGLGLNGLGGSPNVNSSTSTTGSVEEDATSNSSAPNDAAAGVLPPEGSFDRFLVDLQADLRVALTHGAEEEPEDDPISPPLGRTVDGAAVPSIREPRPDVLRTRTEASPEPPVDVHRQPIDQGEGDSTDEDMPGLQDVSDSESDDTDDEDDDEEATSFVDRLRNQFDREQQPTARSEADGFRSSSVGAGRMDASGRINWWRLYRFPAITAPRTPASAASMDESAQGLEAAANTRPSSGSDEARAATTPSQPLAASQSSSLLPTASSLPSQQPEMPSLPASTSAPASSPLGGGESTTPASASGSTPFLPSFLPPPPGQTVVPVIVVGLQSVNANWQVDGPMMPEDAREDPDLDIFGRPATPVSDYAPNSDTLDDEEYGAEDVPLPHHHHHHHHHHQHHHQQHLHPNPHQWSGVSGGSEGGGGASRGRSRGWQSRAANAIRNLRPGRSRTATPGTPSTPPTGPGSRTFMIYVIGGYYPPDHSIVTGGPDNFESFEALLELAEMLGQVKPPTVTKDDIDRSGLEIIKSSQLAQYEEEGKVAYNCTERCLICLDDYEDEDEIRLLTCRHAFHKNCVDKWLQTGRNNCPACRSTGVSSESPAHVSG